MIKEVVPSDHGGLMSIDMSVSVAAVRLGRKLGDQWVITEAEDKDGKPGLLALWAGPIDGFEEAKKSVPENFRGHPVITTPEHSHPASVLGRVRVYSHDEWNALRKVLDSPES